MVSLVKNSIEKEPKFKMRTVLHVLLTCDTLPPEMFGAFGSVWCKMALGEVEVSLP